MKYQEKINLLKEDGWTYVENKYKYKSKDSKYEVRCCDLRDYTEEEVYEILVRCTQ